MKPRLPVPRPTYNELTAAAVALDLAVDAAEDHATRAAPGDDYFAQRARDLRAVERWIEHVRLGGEP